MLFFLDKLIKFNLFLNKKEKITSILSYVIKLNYTYKTKYSSL